MPSARRRRSTSSVRSGSAATRSSETSSVSRSGSQPRRSSARATPAGRSKSSRSAGPRLTATPSPGPMPADLLQRAVEHVGGERARQPALLRERQEVCGREQPAPRVLPAHERLDAGDGPARQVGLRLVVQDELAVVDRVAQLADEREPLAAVVVARRQVDLVAGAHPLGLVHRDVGALQQPDRVGRVLGVERDADARVDVDGDVLDVERALERVPQAQPRGARRGLVAGREHERELVAAQPRERVVLADRARPAAARSGAGPRRPRDGRACR